MTAQLKYPTPHTTALLTRKETHPSFPFKELENIHNTSSSITDNRIQIGAKCLLLKTDHKGYIEYCNKAFENVTGYTEPKIIKNHFSLLWHPQMPKTIYRLMQEHLAKRKNFLMVQKNLTANGNYYWSITEIHTKINYASNSVSGYFFYQNEAPGWTLHEIEPIYRTLSDMEKERGLNETVAYFKQFLHTRQHTYLSYIERITTGISFSKRIANLQRKIFDTTRTKNFFTE